MRVLSYSPSVDVYAAIGVAAGFEFMDLSQDVVQCTVSRKTDAASTFSVRLQNVGNKYNGLFTPMDRIAIRCTKLQRYSLLVGYITKAPAFTVYGADITIEGSCPLYRLQQLYWDPKLLESQELMGYNAAETSWDAVIVNLLTKVAGYSSDQVLIGSMPDEAIAFARDIYQANLDSMTQLKSMTDEFYRVLQTHGPKIVVSGGGMSGAEQTSGGGISLLGDGVNFDVSREKFVNEWGPRIDAYINRVSPGSPVAGHGNVYAEAAWIGRMDPRWLPVIGFHETNLGKAASYAGYPYNLYGWGCADSGETSVARSQDGYDSFIHFILDNAGNRNNGWAGAKVLNEYTDLDELDQTYCSSWQLRRQTLREHMGSI